MLAVYSVIPYKTPWLMLGALPSIILLAVLAPLAVERAPGRF
jgi:hypothetical protein